MFLISDILTPCISDGALVERVSIEDFQRKSFFSSKFYGVPSVLAGCLTIGITLFDFTSMSSNPRFLERSLAEGSIAASSGARISHLLKDQLIKIKRFL